MSTTTPTTSRFKPSRFIGTVKISGPVTPTSPDDIYPSHQAYYGSGGYRSVENIADRDSIVPLRREEGMLVFVISEDEEWRLVGGIENSNWRLESKDGKPVECPDDCGGGGGTTPTDPDPDNGGNQGGGEPGDSYAYLGVPEINEALVNEVIMGLQEGNPNTAYKRNGLIYVPPTDATTFSFLATVSEIHKGQYMFITGTKDTVTIDTVPSGIPDSDGNPIEEVTQVFTETTIEIEHGGITEKYILSKLMDGTQTSPLFYDFFENERIYNGFFKFNDTGYYKITAYQEEILPAGSIDTPRISDKTVHTVEVFEKQFQVRHNDQLDHYPSFLEAETKLPVIEFDITTAPNTDMKCSLVRVDVTPKGINRNKYVLITGMNKIIVGDTTFQIPTETWDKDEAQSGDYALLFQGKDGGIQIPPFFAGPFEVDINYLLRGRTVNQPSSPTTVAPDTSGTNTAPTDSSDTLKQYVADPLEQEFFDALDVIYGDDYPTTVENYISSMDLSGMTSANIDTYVDQIYNNA